MRFRRSRHVVSYWDDDRLVFHNFATGKSLTGPGRTSELLDFFGEWRSIEEFAAWLSMSTREARGVLDRLVNATVLQRSDRKTDSESSMAAWAAWNPAAGFFHSATRNVGFMDFFEGARLLDRKARVSRPPAPVKRYRGVRTHALPRALASGDFPQVLLARRTWRQFARTALTLEALGTLLGLTNGVQHWAEVGGQGGELPLKTSPSGGALHPIEAYVCARNVEGLPRGIYHYASDRHVLELVRPQQRRARVQRYLPTQYWYEGAAAVVFFTAVFERYLWKYDYARAYRALLIEAGHQCQTFCLVATWLGLAPFCSMALSDSSIEDDLELDGVSEAVLYATGVGVRPPGSTVRSNPKGTRPMKTRANPRVVSPAARSAAGRAREARRR